MKANVPLLDATSAAVPRVGRSVLMKAKAVGLGAAGLNARTCPQDFSMMLRAPWAAD